MLLDVCLLLTKGVFVMPLQCIIFEIDVRYLIVCFQIAMISEVIVEFVVALFSVNW